MHILYGKFEAGQLLQELEKRVRQAEVVGHSDKRAKQLRDKLRIATRKMSSSSQIALDFDEVGDLL